METDCRLCIVACLPAAFEHNTMFPLHYYRPAAFLIRHLYAFPRPHPNSSLRPTVFCMCILPSWTSRVDTCLLLCLSCRPVFLAGCHFVSLSIHLLLCLLLASIFLSIHRTSTASVCVCLFVYVFTRSDDKNNSAQYEAKTVLDLNICFLLA